MVLEMAWRGAVWQWGCTSSGSWVLAAPERLSETFRFSQHPLPCEVWTGTIPT